MIQGQEITLIRKDGTSIVCLNTAAAVRDNAGRVVRYQGALMDITERREMERRFTSIRNLRAASLTASPILSLSWIPRQLHFRQPALERNPRLRTSGNRRHGFRSLRPP